MPAQPLTPAQLADAARLKSFFLEWKEDRRARGEPASQETVAAMLGFNTQSSVSQYLNGRIPLNVNVLVKFAALLGKQPEDISLDLAREIQRIAESVPNDSEGEEFIPIRRLDVRLSAGRGQLFTSEEEKSRLSFRADFLQSIGAAPHNTVSVSVSGDSMEPIIPDGSTLLVDRGNRHVINGKVYALRQNGCLLVKRLYTTTMGYVARSDNAAENYPDIPLDAEHPDFEIIGRAVWVGFKL